MAKVLKNIKPDRFNDLKEVYDTRPVYQGNNTVRLFPPNPSGEDTKNSYKGNPLPGDTNYDLLGIGLELIPSVLVADAANNVSPVSIINTIVGSGILNFEVDGGRERAFSTPCSEFFDLRSLTSDPESGVISISSDEVFKLPDPFVLEANRQFRIELQYKDTGALPTEAEWGASEDNASMLGVRAILQFNQYENAF